MSQPIDVATVLEDYLADLANLPAELSFVLDEIKVNDDKVVDHARRAQQRDAAIQKFVHQHGTLVDNPKEGQNITKIQKDYQESIKAQKEKVRMANLGMFVIGRQVRKLEEQVEKLEKEGLLTPASDDEEEAFNKTSTPEPLPPRPSRKSSSHHPPPMPARELKHPASTHEKTPSVSAGSSPGPRDMRPPKRQKLDSPVHSIGPAMPLVSPREGNGDDNVYCFCRQGSRGNMIGCDGSDCDIEWFHLDCVGLSAPPSGTWYCESCRKKIAQAK